MDELMNMRYNDMKGVREYILKMVYLQTRLKALDILIPDNFIVHSKGNRLTKNLQLDQLWAIGKMLK